jgi:enamine deaminase RidA (YjgF/YER057c/UK114 family)
MTDRRLISSGSPFEPKIGFSRAVVIGNRVLVSGTAPIWPDGEVDPDPYVQTKRCLEIIAAALAEAGATLEQVVRTRVYLTAVSDYEAVGQALGETFSRIRPASTMLVIQGLLDSRWKVEIEAEAEI